MKVRRIVAFVVASAAIGAVAAAKVTRFPTGALLIRWLFDRGNAQMARKLVPHAVADITVLSDLEYSPGDRHARLDLYRPPAPTGPLPVILWIHGGGWLSGDKTDSHGYFTILAAAGFAVVSVNYTITPGSKQPTPVRQVNEATRYLLEAADRLQIDPDRVVLAGDSAGAQLASQLVGVITNPGYAAELGVVPALRPDQLRAAILCCGVFDVAPFLSPHVPRMLRWGIGTVLTAYAGTDDRKSAQLLEMTTIDAVTDAYPPTFLTGGDADPMTEHQSRPMAARLREHGVELDAYFPDEPGHPASHEFQFNLDQPAGREALRRMLDFVHRHTIHSGGSTP